MSSGDVFCLALRVFRVCFHRPQCVFWVGLDALVWFGCGLVVVFFRVVSILFSFVPLHFV